MSAFPGGKFGRFYDGEKHVCLDNIDVEARNCLVYSFGLNRDWSFETQMLALGKTVIKALRATKA